MSSDDWEFGSGGSSSGSRFRSSSISSNLVIILVLVLTSALAVGVTLLFYFHSRLGSGDRVSSSASVERVSKDTGKGSSWYDSKSKFSVLPSISNLGDGAIAKDILYTKEFQVSRSFGKVNLDDMLSDLDNLHADLKPSRVIFKSRDGSNLFALRSEGIYLVISYSRGVVALGYSDTDSEDSLKSVYGTSSGDFIGSDYVSSYSKGSWTFRYKSDVDIDKGLLDAEF